MTLSCDESNMSRAAEGIDIDCKIQIGSHCMVKANGGDRLV